MALKDKQNRTIVLPISEAEYDIFLTNNTIAHEVIQSLYDQHPELFPLQMANGYCLNGRDRMSKKMDIQLRKIEISGINYRIRPSFRGCLGIYFEINSRR